MAQVHISFIFKYFIMETVFIIMETLYIMAINNRIKIIILKILKIKKIATRNKKTYKFFWKIFCIPEVKKTLSIFIIFNYDIIGCGITIASIITKTKRTRNILNIQSRNPHICSQVKEDCKNQNIASEFHTIRDRKYTAIKPFHKWQYKKKFQMCRRI